jgi:predicted alpha/beta-fold hydrolase
MDIEQKLKVLETESLQLRLQLIINDVQLFDYYQLALLKNQVENKMEELKLINMDKQQEAKIKSQIKQIENIKERNKRPSISIKKVGDAIVRKKK